MLIKAMLNGLQTKMNLSIAIVTNHIMATCKNKQINTKQNYSILLIWE